jgi:UDP-N-acetylmuramate dehydrogenase
MGGLIKMNAGMKEDEIFNSLYMIKTIHGYIPKEDIAHGYRFTNINDIVYEAVFEIREGFDISKVEAFSKMRKNQPKEPSAGSAFKNPKGDYAGRLIEEVGLKGKRVGNASFSTVHSNFLINHGGATFEDAFSLIEMAKKRVLKTFDIELELEILII